jgi:hypothetical protein
MQKQLGLDVWYVGFVTDENQFISINQAFEANPSWEAEVLAGNALAGTIEIAGLIWEIYPTQSPANPPGTKELAMLLRDTAFTVVIYGTAPDSDFEILAKAIASQLGN